MVYLIVNLDVVVYYQAYLHNDNEAHETVSTPITLSLTYFRSLCVCILQLCVP